MSEWLVAVATAGLGGAVVGAAIGYATYDPDSDALDFGRGFNVEAGAIAGAAIGVSAVLVLWVLWLLSRWLRRGSSQKR